MLCIKCGLPFDLTRDHRGLATICPDCGDGRDVELVHEVTVKVHAARKPRELGALAVRRRKPKRVKKEK